MELLPRISVRYDGKDANKFVTRKCTMRGLRGDALNERHDQCRKCRDDRKQRNTAHKRGNMLLRILIGRFFWNEREAGALCVPPPEQVNDQQVEQAEPLAEDEKVPKRGQISVKGENALED